MPGRDEGGKQNRAGRPLDYGANLKKSWPTQSGAPEPKCPFQESPVGQLTWGMPPPVLRNRPRAFLESTASAPVLPRILRAPQWDHAPRSGTSFFSKRNASGAPPPADTLIQVMTHSKRGRGVRRAHGVSRGRRESPISSSSGVGSPQIVPEAEHSRRTC